MKRPDPRLRCPEDRTLLRAFNIPADGWDDFFQDMAYYCPKCRGELYIVLPGHEGLSERLSQ